MARRTPVAPVCMAAHGDTTGEIAADLDNQTSTERETSSPRLEAWRAWHSSACVPPALLQSPVAPLLQSALSRQGLETRKQEARQIFHHSLQGWPNLRQRLSTEQQKQCLVKAGLLHPACAADAAFEDWVAASRHFLWDEDFQAYDEKDMRSVDPNYYKWCTGKQLFDYTPHVTKEDWLSA